MTALTRRRKGRTTMTYPAGWQVTDHTVIHGRHVLPGTLLSFAGKRGRFRFVKQVTSPAATWLDVVGPLGSPRNRSFYRDEVRTVHRDGGMRA